MENFTVKLGPRPAFGDPTRLDLRCTLRNRFATGYVKVYPVIVTDAATEVYEGNYSRAAWPDSAAFTRARCTARRMAGLHRRQGRFIFDAFLVAADKIEDVRKAFAC